MISSELSINTDTPTSRTEFTQLVDQKAFLEKLRERRTTIAQRVARVRDATKSKLGIINKRLEKVDKALAKADDALNKAQQLMDEVFAE